MIYYPWTNRTVQENDLVWVYDGQRLVRVVKIVETEREMSLITKQSADARFHNRLKNRILEEKSYLLISVSRGDDSQRKLGGGTLFVLYDKDTYECLAFYRTR